VCAVTGVILALVLKSTGSSMGTFVSVVLCVGTAMLVFNGLISVYTKMFTAGINQEYIKLIVKVIGISYVTEISSNICKENGFAALASAMEIYARISVAGLCIPVIVTLFEIVSEGIV
jgi:stage III sporulation protein AD